MSGDEWESDNEDAAEGEKETETGKDEENDGDDQSLRTLALAGGITMVALSVWAFVKARQS